MGGIQRPLVPMLAQEDRGLPETLRGPDVPRVALHLGRLGELVRLTLQLLGLGVQTQPDRPFQVADGVHDLQGAAAEVAGLRLDARVSTWTAVALARNG